MIARSTRLALILALSVIPTFVAAPALSARESEELGELRRIARTGIEQGLTAGMSVSVVQDDRILWQESFGEADVETHRPVKPNTRFYIASTSKALTGLAAACLAERGVIDLSAPLSKALPALQLPEGLSPDSVTVLDLLTHTHGIDPKGPVTLRMSITGEYTNEEVLRLARFHGLARGGRSFQYSNVGYELAGIVMAPQTGGWKEVVEREVLVPLGMTHTTSYRSRLAESDLAMPHEMGRERMERVRLAKVDANLGPAGGHFSTAGDLARLVVTELHGGVLDGKQVVPSQVIAKTQAQLASQDREFGAYHRHGWGIGWDLGTYKGDTLLHRFGGFAGYYSHVSFMPDRRIGVVVLVNGGSVSGRLADAVANAIYDRLAGRVDQEKEFADVLASVAERAEKERATAAEEAAKQAAPPQALPSLEIYAGTYFSEVFGTLVLEVHEGALEAVMGATRSPVEVVDGEKHQLGVRLLGFPSVITAAPGPGERIDAVELLDERFERR